MGPSVSLHYGWRASHVSLLAQLPCDSPMLYTSHIKIYHTCNMATMDPCSKPTNPLNHAYCSQYTQNQVKEDYCAHYYTCRYLLDICSPHTNKLDGVMPRVLHGETAQLGTWGSVGQSQSMLLLERLQCLACNFLGLLNGLAALAL